MRHGYEDVDVFAGDFRVIYSRTFFRRWFTGSDDAASSSIVMMPPTAVTQDGASSFAVQQATVADFVSLRL